MHIEEFIEQDILVYLDKMLEDDSREETPLPGEQSTVYVTRDYEEELLHALDHYDIPQAKKVLHDLKGRFDESPSGTEEKRQLKAMLTSLYEKFKERIEAEQTFSKMDQDLSALMGAPGRPESKTLQAPAPNGELEPQEQAPIEPERAPPQAPLPERIEEMLTQAAHACIRSDLDEAIARYREAKRSVLGLEEVPDVLVREFQQVYGAIRAAMLPRKESLDRDLLWQMQREKLELDSALQRDDVEGAMRHYRRMRSLAYRIADHNIAEDAASKLITIHRIIERVRTHLARVP